MTAPALMTADELLHINVPNQWTELVRGRLVVREPPGYLHGYVALRIAAAISTHVDANGLGVVLAAETGFKLFANPDTVRAPDVAFLARDRVPSPAPRGYAELAPDLVVEVLSPDDQPAEVREKIADWLGAGCRLVWIVDPMERTAHVHRADGADSVVADGDLLRGETVLPDFTLPLANVLL